MRRLCSIWALVALCMAVPALAADGDVLHVLAWPGYADADVVKAFEQQHQVKVVVTLVDSDESLWDKLHAQDGELFDVLAANTAEIQRYYHNGMLQPLDVSRLPNTRFQLPRFDEPMSLCATWPRLRRRGGPSSISPIFSYQTRTTGRMSSTFWR